MPLTKHWNYEQDVVKTSIHGMCLANPHLNYLKEERVVFNSKDSKSKITVLSGGGSGHEPLHLGFVGDNLLDVAVCGSVFASPSVKQIVAGLNTKPSDKGAIIIVKNYTGDILHFGLAGERAKASNIDVETLIVQDDVSVGRTKNGFVGRRGLAGTCMVHKVVGGKAATSNASLKEVAQLGQRVIDNLVTIGASLDHVTIPGSAAANKEEDSDDSDEEERQILGDDEIEIGMGIHNEPGIKRVSPIPTVDKLVESLLVYLLDPNDKERHYVDFDPKDEVVLLLNNLGSTSNLELYAIQSIVVAHLQSKWGISPVRIYTGTFTSSLDGPGISITLLNATKAGGQEVLDLLDLPTNAPGWNSQAKSSAWGRKDFVITEPPQESNVSSNIEFDPIILENIIRAGAQRVVEVEPKVTLYDTVAGDGDCGETLVSGVTGLLDALNDKSLELKDAVKSLDEITDIVESAMGGTSGGIYSIFISAVNSYLKTQDDANKTIKVDSSIMAQALQAGLSGLQKYTRARIGDRTLMDALIPFIETFSDTKDIKLAAKAAYKGAESTRKLAAKFGRASYVGEEEFKQFESEGGLPDPGAIGLAALLNGFVDGFYKI